MTNSTARVLNDENWDNVIDIEELKRVNTPSLGNRHTPVNHGTALEIFKTTLDERGIKMSNEHGMLNSNVDKDMNMKYIFVADVRIPGIDDYVLNFGFVNFNNKQKSFTILLGERVMVCSNECFTHQLADLGRRHIGDSVIESITEKIDIGAERFLDFTENRVQEIDGLKSVDFTDQMAGEALLDFHRNGRNISNSNIGRIVSEYDNPCHEEFKGRNGWNFLNACTETFKCIDNPVLRMSAQSHASKTINNICKI